MREPPLASAPTDGSGNKVGWCLCPCPQVVQLPGEGRPWGLSFIPRVAHLLPLGRKKGQKTHRKGGRWEGVPGPLSFLASLAVLILEVVRAGLGRVRPGGWGGAGFCPPGGFSSQVGLVRQTYDG